MQRYPQTEGCIREAQSSLIQVSGLRLQTAGCPGPPDVVEGDDHEPRGADRFHYRLHVLQSDGQQRVIEVSEDDMPQALGMLAKPGLP